MASTTPYDNHHDDESLLDNDLLDADDGTFFFSIYIILVTSSLTLFHSRDRSRRPIAHHRHHPSPRPHPGRHILLIGFKRRGRHFFQLPNLVDPGRGSPRAAKHHRRERLGYPLARPARGLGEDASGLVAQISPWRFAAGPRWWNRRGGERRGFHGQRVWEWFARAGGSVAGCRCRAAGGHE
jgi:hypothetical protein